MWYASGEKGDKLWGSGNNGTATLGKNITEPEDDFVAVKGRGKRAARLKSQFVGVLGMGKFASACLYTGHFIKLTGMSGARFSFGGHNRFIPFDAAGAGLPYIIIDNVTLHPAYRQANQE